MHTDTKKTGSIKNRPIQNGKSIKCTIETKKIAKGGGGVECNNQVTDIGLSQKQYQMHNRGKKKKKKKDHKEKEGKICMKHMQP